MSSSEGFIPLNGSGGNSAPVAGGRRRSHKLRMVKKSTVRRMLRSKGLKMRGGGESTETPATGGRRHRKSRGTRRTRRRSLFGMKY